MGYWVVNNVNDEALIIPGSNELKTGLLLKIKGVTYLEGCGFPKKKR